MLPMIFSSVVIYYGCLFLLVFYVALSVFFLFIQKYLPILMHKNGHKLTSCLKGVFCIIYVDFISNFLFTLVCTLEHLFTVEYIR